jgi:RNA polymerase sigma-70 factor (ECF subfamily)
LLPTPRTLLDRLRTEPDATSWRRLVDLYTPLIRRWFERYRVPGGDVEDLVQDVLAVIARDLRNFVHNEQPGAFRRWLRTITVHKAQGYWRGRQRGELVVGVAEMEQLLGAIEDPASDLNRQWEREHDEHVAARLLELIEPEFAPSTWEAFRLQVIEGVKAAEAAEALRISVNAALIAKSRVLRRFRREIEGLTE